MKKKYKLIYKGDIKDFDQQKLDRDYWRDKSTTEKFREARRLADQLLKIQGRSYTDVSRLLRTTAVLKRS